MIQSRIPVPDRVLPQQSAPAFLPFALAQNAPAEVAWCLTLYLFWWVPMAPPEDRYRPS